MTRDLASPVSDPPAGARARYRDLLRDVGPAFVLLGLAGRLPGGMLPLGFLLYAAHHLGSFALAGLVVGALSVGGGLGGPAMGALADRFGQRVVGLVATALGLVSLTGWMITVAVGAPLPLVLGLAAVVGASNPQAGSMARSRWEVRARERTDRSRYAGAAMALEGALDETAFVAGPVLVSVLAGTVHPAAGLLAALGVGIVGQAGFALHPSALGPSGPRGSAGVSGPIPVAGLAPLVVTVVAVGLVFGSTQTGVAAHVTVVGRDELAGGVYAFLGLGSALAGLFTTRIPDRVPLPWRMISSAAALVLLSGSLIIGAIAGGGPVGLAIGCFLTGVAVGPVLISAYSVAGAFAPVGRAATVMTSLATATVVGVALGASLAGQLVDGVGVSAALAIPAGAGVLAVLAGVGSLVAGGRADPAAPPPIT